MDRGVKSLILGIAVGAAGVVLALRIRQIVEERDPESMLDQLGEQMKELERRIVKAEG